MSDKGRFRLWYPMNLHDFSAYLDHMTIQQLVKTRLSWSHDSQEMVKLSRPASFVGWNLKAYIDAEFVNKYL